MPPRLTEITVHVEDMASEAAFWEHGVGLPRLRPAPGEPLGRYAVFDMGGPRYELIADSPPRLKPANKIEAGSSPVLLVPDVEAAVAQAVAHGGRPIEPIRAIPPDAKAAFVCSPSGYSVCFVQGDEAGYRASMGQKPLPDYWSAE